MIKKLIIIFKKSLWGRTIKPEKKKGTATSEKSYWKDFGVKLCVVNDTCI